jgi:hypothetical protein
MNGPVALLLAASVWATPPDWAVSGKSLSHPSALWVVGAGSSTESVDLARQAAMADVVRQIRSRVKSTSEDEHWEASSSQVGRTKGETSWTGSKVQAAEEITGIQIAETAQDGRVWYAMAVLDKSAFAAPGRAAMREAETEGRERLAGAIDGLNQRHPVEALDALARVEIARSKFNTGRDRAALGETDALSESFPISQTQVDSLRREVARGLELRRRVDSVEVGADKNWPAAAGLGVRFRGVPVAGLDVDLVGPTGQILGTNRTDSSGFAPVHPGQLPTTTNSGWSRWSLRPRLELRPGAEIGLMVKMVSSSTRIRLDWVGSVDLEPRELVRNRLAANGWTLDATKGVPIKAQLSKSPKGEVAGFSETLKRWEVRLVLIRGAVRYEATGLGTGNTDAKAVENAIAKLAFPPETLRELLHEK